MGRNHLIRFRRGTASDWTSVNPLLASGEPGQETDTGLFKIGNGIDLWDDLDYIGSGGVSDGDKGDITVSGGGTVWSIDALAVTNSEINDVAWSKVTGTPTTLSGYGISDTKTNFNSACSDGDFLFVGDVVGVTDGDKGDITVSSSGTVWTIDNDSVTYAKIQNVSATDRILGRSTAGAGDIEEITCTSAGRALLDDADSAAQRETLGVPSRIMKTTETQVVNNSTTLVTDDTLTLSIPNASRYDFEFIVQFLTNAAGDFKFRINTSAVPTEFAYNRMSVPPLGTGLSTANEEISTDTAVTSANAGTGFVRVTGRVYNNTGSALNLEFQWAQNTASVFDTKVLIGSRLIYERVT